MSTFAIDAFLQPVPDTLTRAQTTVVCDLEHPPGGLAAGWCGMG